MAAMQNLYKSVFNCFKLMEAGLTGRTGVIVLSRVEAEYRIDQELVPIPLQNSEGSHVLERPTKQERAMKTLVQVIFLLI